MGHTAFLHNIPASFGEPYLLHLLSLFSSFEQWTALPLISPVNGNCVFSSVYEGFVSFTTQQGVTQIHRLLNNFMIDGRSLKVNIDNAVQSDTETKQNDARVETAIKRLFKQRRESHFSLSTTTDLIRTELVETTDLTEYEVWMLRNCHIQLQKLHMQRITGKLRKHQEQESFEANILEKVARMRQEREWAVNEHGPGLRREKEKKMRRRRTALMEQIIRDGNIALEVMHHVEGLFANTSDQSVFENMHIAMSIVNETLLLDGKVVSNVHCMSADPDPARCRPFELKKVPLYGTDEDVLYKLIDLIPISRKALYEIECVKTVLNTFDVEGVLMESLSQNILPIAEDKTENVIEFVVRELFERFSSNTNSCCIALDMEKALSSDLLELETAKKVVIQLWRHLVFLQLISEYKQIDDKQ
ncbi:hypothetical protein PCE1_001743 [Barthelona sp. PCE]